MVICPVIIEVVDPGEGPGGGGGGYFQTVLMPDGPKKNFGDWPSPSSQGLDDRPPYLKLWIRHCIDHSRKYHNIPWALSLVSLGPKKNWKQCLYKILEWPTKSIMVCYGIFWNSQLYSQQSPEFSCKPSPGELTWWEQDIEVPTLNLRAFYKRTKGNSSERLNRHPLTRASA